MSKELDPEHQRLFLRFSLQEVPVSFEMAYRAHFATAASSGLSASVRAHIFGEDSIDSFVCAETLVHSSFTPIANADFVISVDVEGVSMQVYVIKRPWLDYFLQQVSSVFEVVMCAAMPSECCFIFVAQHPARSYIEQELDSRHIHDERRFTASLRKYADGVMDHIDKLGAVRARLYRDACVLHCGSYVKDLSRIGRSLEKIVLVDNSALSYSFQPANGLPSNTFLEDATDTQLLEILNVLMQVNGAADVRTELPAVRERLGYHAGSVSAG